MRSGAVTKVIAVIIGTSLLPFMWSYVLEAYALPGVWTEAFPSQTPGPKRSAGWAYDSNHKVIVLFGGVPNMSETWLYDVTRNIWTQKFPAVSPPPRSVHQMTYDSFNDKVVLFGGYATAHGTELNDTWLYDVDDNTWTEVKPLIKPGARHWPGLTYDKINRVVVLFGGHKNLPLAPDVMYNDTWLFNVTSGKWTKKFPSTSPSPRQVMPIYNDVDGKMYIFGGKYEDGGVLVDTFNDIWSYNVSTNTWIVVEPNSTATSVPSDRRAPWVYDPVNNRAVLYGGLFAPNDTWVYDFDTMDWSEVDSSVTPTGRISHHLIFDPVNSRFMLYGGKTATEIVGDTWYLTLQNGQGSTLCNGLTPTILGTANDDVITGTASRDVISGLGGDDILRGGEGDDVICGGIGRDTIIGGLGNDNILGQDGDDALYGNEGNDILDGGAGTDFTGGGAGIDTCLNSESRQFCES